MNNDNGDHSAEVEEQISDMKDVYSKVYFREFAPGKDDKKLREYAQLAIFFTSYYDPEIQNAEEVKAASLKSTHAEEFKKFFEKYDSIYSDKT